MKNNKYLANERYAEVFEKHEGYFIARGVIESPDTFHFLCDEINPEDREEYDEEIEPFDAETRNGFVTIRTKNKDEPANFRMGWTGYSYLRIIPFNSVVLGVDFYGEMLTYNHQGDHATLGNISAHVTPEKIVHLNGENVPTKALVRIDNRIFIGVAGGILECISTSEFNETLSYRGSEKSEKLPIITHISGLAENDLYFVADDRTVCYFNGNEVKGVDHGLQTLLKRKAFHRHPIRDGSMSTFAHAFEEEKEETITALGYFGKKEIFVGTSLGRIFRCKEEQWSEMRLSRDVEKIEYPVHDIVLYKSRIHFVCGFTTRNEIKERDRGRYLYAIDNEEVVLADVPEAVHRFAENLHAKDGQVLVSGKAGSVLWNGSEWEVLIDRDGYKEATKFRPSEERVQKVAAEKAAYATLKTKIESLGEFGDDILKQDEFPLQASIIADPYPISYAKSGDDLSAIDPKTVVYIDGDFEYDGTLIAEFPLLVINGDVKVNNLVVLNRLHVAGTVVVSNTLYTDSDYENSLMIYQNTFCVQGSVTAKEWLYAALKFKIGGDLQVGTIAHCPDDCHETVFENSTNIQAAVAANTVKILSAEIDEMLVSQLLDEEGYYEITEVLAFLNEGKQILK